MKMCCVPHCQSVSSKKTTLCSLPSDHFKGVINPLKQRRRRAWLQAIYPGEKPQKSPKSLLVCSKHFLSGTSAPPLAPYKPPFVGQPALSHQVHHSDWIPTQHMPSKASNLVLKQKNEFVRNIIENLPEITEKFDVPDYVIIDKEFFNERKIEHNLIRKYISNPFCDENGYYNNDHDYLGLPLRLSKTEKRQNERIEDHNYSLVENPACLYFDLSHFCNVCRCNCANLFTFNSHMMGHTVRNDVTCEICKQTFLTSTCLNNHMATHTALCDKCGNQVPTGQLSAHQMANKRQKLQNQAIGKYVIHQEEKVYFCIFCMKAFEKLKEFAKHTSLHRKIEVRRGKENAMV